MDLMDKERALNNYMDIIKAHIEGKTILFKDRVINEEWHKIPDDFINFNFDYFEYKIIPEHIPFETPEEVVKNIRGRMVKNKYKNNIYYSISYVNEHLIVIQGQFGTNSFTFEQAFDLLEFEDFEPFGKLKEE